MKNYINLVIALVALAFLLMSNAATAQLTTNDGKIHFNSSTQPSQRLYGNNSAQLAYYSKHSTVTHLSIYDKENKLYGRLYGSGNGANFGLVDGDGNWSLLAVKDDYTAFKINSSEKMRIKSNGYVGIGTTAPARHLHVMGVVRSSYAAGAAEYLEINHGGGNAYINTVGDGNIDFRHDGGTKMSLTSAGRLGIGITAPSQVLHTKGVIRSSNSVNTAEYLEINHGGTNAYINAVGDGNIDFRHDNSTKMSLTSAGGLGIGTTNLGTYKLAVNGSIRAKEVKVESNWSDYVFYDDYQLPTLEEEQKHIEKNGHLLGFESEREMEGMIPLGDVSRRQQAKIEEMMLHLIQMNEQLKVMQAKVTDLEQENTQLKKQLRTQK